MWQYKMNEQAVAPSFSVLLVMHGADMRPCHYLCNLGLGATGWSETKIRGELSNLH